MQVFGRKKTATAVAYCKRGKGLIKEPVLLLGKDRFADVDIRIRQALSKSLVAYYQKFVDEQTKKKTT